MSKTLINKIEELKKKEKALADELNELEQKKESEKSNLQKQLNDTLKELLLEQKKQFEESQKKESIDSFLETQDAENNQSTSIFDLDDTLYESVKSVTEKPYDLWADPEKEFVQSLTYQIDKLKTSYGGQEQEVMARTSSLLKSDDDKKYIV